MRDCTSEEYLRVLNSYPDFDIVNQLSNGESFGEIAVLTGETR